MVFSASMAAGLAAVGADAAEAAEIDHAEHDQDHELLEVAHRSRIPREAGQADKTMPCFRIRAPGIL